MTTARDLTMHLRQLWMAPMSLSVRADPADPARFYLRVPKAAERGAPPFDRRWPWLEDYLGRRVPVPVQVIRERYIRRRDRGQDVEFAIVLGRPE